MAKDYKAYSSKSKSGSKSSSKSKLKLIIWIVVVIVLGLGFVKILHELSNKSVKTEKTLLVQPVVQSKKLEEKPQKVKFEFYSMLPKDQVTVSEDVKTVDVTPVAPNSVLPSPAVVAAVGNYIVQVASVRALTDAETLRAKLTLLGFDAKVQKTVAQGITWYRVNIGPVATKEDAINVQNNLRKNNIDSFVKKLNP